MNTHASCTSGETGDKRRWLRVTAGSQQGAELALDTATRYSIGADADCDIVLDDAPAIDARLELTLDAGALRLEVQAGEIHMGGTLHDAGHSVTVVRGIPVTFGDAEFVLSESIDRRAASVNGGEPDATDAHLGEASTASVQGGTNRVASDTVSAQPRRTPRALSWFSRAVLGAGGTAALVWMLSATGGFDGIGDTSTERGHENVASSLMSLMKLIDEAELAPLTVVETAPQRFLISGMLETRSERNRLERLLQERPEHIVFETPVAEDILDAVREIYRSSGIKANIVSRGFGKVLARTAVDDLDKLRQVESAVRTDVPDLVSLQRENQVAATLAAPHTSDTYMPEAGKRVSLVVDGRSAFVMTEDLSHYFIGSELPSGHAITSIEGSEVTLVKDGKQSELDY